MISDDVQIFSNFFPEQMLFVCLHINCYSIYIIYIDFILENAERKPGKHGQGRSRTRRKNSPTSRGTRTTKTNRKRTGTTVEVYQKVFFLTNFGLISSE